MKINLIYEILLKYDKFNYRSRLKIELFLNFVIQSDINLQIFKIMTKEIALRVGLGVGAIIAGVLAKSLLFPNKNQKKESNPQ